MQEHVFFMERCVQLAQLGAGFVAPNPMVGSVLVHKNTIIGEGYHATFGQAHAEVNCINSVQEQHQHLIKDATLYVSLEPCNHFGKTPPCVDVILASQIKKVVIGCTDTFSKVNGSGIAKLIDNGVEVIANMLHKKCRSLNKAFFTYQEKKRPYIFLKWAATANGFISEQAKKPIKISNSISDSFSHKLRSQVHGIAVGKNTMVADNPKLNVRNWVGQNPKPFLFTSAVNNLEEFTIGKLTKQITSSNKNVQELVEKLYGENIQSVLIEGGADILQQFIDANLWDEAFEIINTELSLNNGVAAPRLKQQQALSTFNFLNDEVTHFKNSLNEFL
jgi:diaminohydroxyphosphoribosylaminopyrimidine deaminase / 5-amino-6-(5-phosphoribosylamino)uracil reductase